MNVKRLDVLTEALLEKEYWIVDIFPRQVSAERGSAYFAAERFFLERPRLKALYDKFASLLVELSCYYALDLCVDEAWTEAPAPQKLYEQIVGCVDGGWCNVLLPEEKALITFRGGDLYMTLYHPSQELTETIRQLAAAEGLFVRPGEDESAG